MIFTYFLNFNNEFALLSENFVLKQNLFNFENFFFFLHLTDFIDINFIFLSKCDTSSIIKFINQAEDFSFFDNLENIKSIYHYSIPNTKLAYPEPFIASASMMHSDLWFIHILIYQYWLWFVFVFLIIFFFITFICTVRWCNMRVRPRRETRGVSRSKCGDLITATVPVSWATSIIVHESTDAIDFYDGFGTSELVVGVRAYQWGWEYYYPKDIDLNYNIKNNYSTFVGNSLKYDTTSDLNLKTNNVWKFYQNKFLDQIVTPAHLLFLPIDNFKLLNFLNFSDVGSSPLHESVAFKKTRMFSKTSSYDLINTSFTSNTRYKKLAFYFNDENSFASSLWLGTKRQHNFLNSSSITNSYDTFFDFKSSNKWLSFNFNFKEDSQRSAISLNFINFFKKNDLTGSTTNSLRILNFFKEYPSLLTNFNKFLYFPSINQLLNDDSDKKKILHPMYKINNIFKKEVDLGNLRSVLINNSTHDLNNFSESYKNELFDNVNKTYKQFSAFCSNQTVMTSSKTLRNFVNISPAATTLNHNLTPNTVTEYVSFIDKTPSINNFFIYNLNCANWNDLTLFNKLASNRIYLDSPYSPIVSNNFSLNFLNFDNYSSTFVESTPTVLQGKEEQLPSYLISTYWNFYWNNSDPVIRIKNNINYKILHDKFYLPLFSFYYDYDFRNWQNLELFEDSFWENIFSIYVVDDYLSMAKDFYSCENSDNTSLNYYKLDNFLKLNNKNLEHSSNSVNFNSFNIFYSNYFYADDYVSPTNLTDFSSFFIYPILNLQNSIEDTYESLKFLNYFYNLNHKLFFLNNFGFCLPHSYSTVFDSYRSDFDEFSWFFDDKNYLKITATLFDVRNLFNGDFLNLNHHQISFVSDWTLFNLYRFTDHINLRSPVRNSIVTYNAMQKVFRARFDEGRSNSNMLTYSFSNDPQPYISAPRFKYEKLLSKNKEAFFDINFYKNSINDNFNSFYDSFTSLNFYAFDFPFLLAMKSDASRYLWFDWFTKWGFYEVQPSSASRYAIYGMPYFNKNFEFSTQLGENFTENETYLLRIARARRNYLPNWTYTPYLYAKSVNWYKNNIFFEILNFNKNTVNITIELLNEASWYWTNLFGMNKNNYLFTPTSSNINSYAKSFWKPQASIQSYYYCVSVLADILSKREYLYRELLNINNKIISIPHHLTASPSNPLMQELKSVFLFVDPLSFNNEYARDVYYSSLNYFNLNVAKSLITDFNDIFNVSTLTSYLLYYLIDYKAINEFKINQELFQNQYRPMRKGINNMIRLHATGAIAMPIEVKLQLLASSKDVIHSWAIPSAGIKIDCVPGYSSHKVTIFLVSGIFWGQCMEICGRYHHWMPIVVYFMKRDLFFLWCTHFVFLSGANNMWNINDRQFTNYVRVVSYDKLSWLSEINNF